MVLKQGVSPYKPGSLVWKKIKLHGTQTQGVFIIKKCWAWKKIKLHGTQTSSGLGHSRGAVWKKIKLHGTQTPRCFASLGNMVWKKIKLHGTQIPPRYALPVTGLVEGKITWYSNTDFPGCLAE